MVIERHSVDTPMDCNPHTLPHTRRHARRDLVHHWVLCGCPVAAINRVVEKGLRTFPRLETLEMNECALRGDPSFRLVTRALKRHRCVGKVMGILVPGRGEERGEGRRVESVAGWL